MLPADLRAKKMIGLIAIQPPSILVPRSKAISSSIHDFVFGGACRAGRYPISKIILHGFYESGWTRIRVTCMPSCKNQLVWARQVSASQNAVSWVWRPDERPHRITLSCAVSQGESSRTRPRLARGRPHGRASSYLRKCAPTLYSVFPLWEHAGTLILSP